MYKYLESPDYILELGGDIYYRIQGSILSHKVQGNIFLQ